MFFSLSYDFVLLFESCIVWRPRHWVLLVICLGNKIKYLSGNLVKYSDSLKVTSIIAHINGGAWIKRRQAEWEQCITIHYTLHCITAICNPANCVYNVNTDDSTSPDLLSKGSLSEENIEPILGSLWRILTYNAKETSAKASKKDKSQARQCHSDPGREW